MRVGLAGCVVLTTVLLTGCGGDDDGAASSPSETTSSADSEQPEETPDETPSETADEPATPAGPTGAGLRCLRGEFAVVSFAGEGYRGESVTAGGGDLTMAFDRRNWEIRSRGASAFTYTSQIADGVEIRLRGAIVGQLRPGDGGTVDFGPPEVRGRLTETYPNSTREASSSTAIILSPTAEGVTVSCGDGTVTISRTDPTPLTIQLVT